MTKSVILFHILLAMHGLFVHVYSQCTRLATHIQNPQPVDCQAAINNGNLTPWFTACQTICLNNTNAGNSGDVAMDTCSGGSNNDLFLYAPNPYAQPSLPNYDGSLVFRWVDWPNRSQGAKPPYFSAHLEMDITLGAIQVASINCNDGFFQENVICLRPDSLIGNQFYAMAGTLPDLATLTQIARNQTGQNVDVNDVAYWMQLVTSDGGQGPICFEVSQYQPGYLCGDPIDISLSGSQGLLTGSATGCLCGTALYGGLQNVNHNVTVPCTVESDAAMWFRIDAPYACNTIDVSISNWGGSDDYNLAVLSSVNCPGRTAVNDFTGDPIFIPGQTLDAGYVIEAANCGGPVSLACTPVPAGVYYIYVSGKSERPSFTVNVTVGDASAAAGTASSPQNGQSICSGATVDLSASGAILPLQASCGQDIAWYYHTSPGFNPYNGQGTYGTSGVNATLSLPPNTSCNPKTYYIKGILSDDGTSAIAGCPSTTNTLSVTVYPEIGTPTIVNTQCLITVAARCNNFTVNGNPGVSSFAATFADDSTIQNFVISNGLSSCNVVVSEMVTCSGNCTQPVATATTVCDALDPYNFYVDVTFSPGSAASYFITDSEGGILPINSAGTYRAGPYSNNTTVYITIENSDDPNCNLPLGGFSDDCNTVFCPNLTSATTSVTGTGCAGDFVILQATVDQGVINQDFTLQWYVNNQPIPGANTLTYLHTFSTNQTCTEEAQTFHAEIECLLPDASPPSTSQLNAGTIIVFPKPVIGRDFKQSSDNCTVAPVDLCGNLSINYTPTVNPTPGSPPVTVSYSVAVNGAPSGCATTGSYIVDCPDCSTRAGEGITPADNVFCYGEPFQVSNTGVSLRKGYVTGWAHTTQNPYSNLFSAVSNAILQGDYFGPDTANSVYTFVNGTDYQPGTHYFIPFASLLIDNSQPAWQTSGSAEATAPFVGDVAIITVPSNIPYCPGITRYNITFTATQQSNTGVLNAIDSVVGNLVSYNGGSTSSLTLTNNNYMGDPRGEVVRLHVSGNLFWGSIVNYTFTITFVNPVSFPTICPECNDVGQPVEVELLPQIQLSQPATPQVCDGAPFDLTTLNPSANVPGSYTWFDGDPNSGGTVITDPRNVIPVNGTQYYVVFAAAADSTCTAQTSLTINTIAPPVLNPIPPQPPVCIGTPVDLTALEGGITSEPGEFIWYKGDPDSNGVRLPDAIASNLLPVDSQWYYVVFESFNTGCRQKTRVLFDVIPLPDLNAPMPPVICAGDTFDLTTLEPDITSAAGMFQWYSGDPDNGGVALTSAQASAQTPGQGDVYYAIFTDSTTGCSSRVSVSFTINPLPVLNHLGNAGTICYGDTVDLTSFESSITTDPGIFQWYIGDPDAGGTPLTPQDAMAQVPTGNETYFAIYTNLITGCMAKTSLTFTVNASPSLNPVPDQEICAGQVVDLTQHESTLGGIGGYYIWYDGNPSAGGTALTNQQAANQMPLSDHTYYVKFTSFSNNCAAVVPVNYTVHPLPVLDTVNILPRLCDGQAVNLHDYDSLFTVSPGIFQWYDGNPSGSGQAIPPAQAVHFKPVDGRNYYVLFTDTNGCSSAGKIAFDVLNPIGGTVAGYDCITDSLYIDLSATTGGAGAGYHIAWNSPNQPGDSLPDGAHWTVVIEDSLGCRDTLQGTVSCLVCSAGTADAMSDSVICCGEQIHFTVSNVSLDATHDIAWAVTGVSDGLVQNALDVQAAHQLNRVFPGNPDNSFDFAHQCNNGTGALPAGEYYFTPFIINAITVDPVVWDTTVDCDPFAEICPVIYGTDWEMNPLILTFPNGQLYNVNQELAFGLPINQALLDAVLGGNLPCFNLTDLYRGDPNGVWSVTITNTGTSELIFELPTFQISVSADSCPLLGGADQIIPIPGITDTIPPNGGTGTFSFHVPPLPGGFPDIDPGCEDYGQPVKMLLIDEIAYDSITFECVDSSQQLYSVTVWGIHGGTPEVIAGAQYVFPEPAQYDPINDAYTFTLSINQFPFTFDIGDDRSHAAGSGCTTSVTLNDDPCRPNGIPKPVVRSDWQIYPNPNNGSFLVRFNANGGNYLLEVYNIYGKPVSIKRMKTALPGVHQLPVNLSLPVGVYLVRLSNQYDTYSIKKLIIE